MKKGYLLMKWVLIDFNCNILHKMTVVIDQLTLDVLTISYLLPDINNPM